MYKRQQYEQKQLSSIINTRIYSPPRDQPEADAGEVPGNQEEHGEAGSGHHGRQRPTAGPPSPVQAAGPGGRGHSLWGPGADHPQVRDWSKAGAVSVRSRHK